MEHSIPKGLKLLPEGTTPTPEKRIVDLVKLMEYLPPRLRPLIEKTIAMVRRENGLG